MNNKLLSKDTYKIKKSSYIWNILSSTAKAIQLTVFLALISRVTMPEDAGIMSLAFSIAYLMRTIGDYSMRNFQVTDTTGKYTFGDYLTSRVITLFAMIICSVLYVSTKGYHFEKFITILLICFYMGIDAMEDVFHGMFQVNNRLDLAAFTEFIRYVCGMAVFGISLYVFQKLWLATLILTCFSIACFFFLNVPIIRIFNEAVSPNAPKKVAMLLGECFPLFIGAFLSAYVNNAPKKAIDSVLNDEIQGYFGMIFMPAFVINLFSTMIYRPITVELAEKYKHNLQEYIKKIKKQYCIIAGILSVCMVVAMFLGIPVLSLFYRVYLGDYKSCFLILMFGGGIGAAISFSSVLLTIQRRQKVMYYAYGSAVCASFFFSTPLVQKWNILGASILYTLLNIVILIIMCVSIGGDIIKGSEVIGQDH